MRRVDDPLSHLLARSIVLDTGCRVLPNHLDHPSRYATAKAHGRTVKAHRFVYESEHGPTSLYVCHTCDYPPCFEIGHLFEGTQADNMLDMYGKKRRIPLRGVDHPQGLPPELKQSREEKNTYLREWRRRKKENSSV